MKDTGIPEAVVMELLGHDSKQMSAHYPHVGREAMQTARASLSELYSRFHHGVSQITPYPNDNGEWGKCLSPISRCEFFHPRSKLLNSRTRVNCSRDPQK